MRAPRAWWIHGLTLCGMLLTLVGCGPEYPNCEDDEGCRDPNLYCVDGTCQHCREDSDCGPDACGVCENGSCERKEGCCASAYECPLNAPFCSRELNQCQECVFDSHCHDQFDRCIEGLCQPLRCNANRECPNDYACAQGACVLIRACHMQPIYFEYNSSTIPRHQLSSLDFNIRCFRLYRNNTRRNAKIYVSGHADERGTDGFNMRLSRRRAENIKKYMVDNGIKKSQVITTARGERDPIVPNAKNGDSHRLNRRAELDIR